MSVYIVDTNFFIEAHRVNYPIDIAQSYWKKVKQLASQKKIISIDKVKNEIFKNNDKLKEWCTHNLPSDFFKSSKENLDEYRIISSWAISKSNLYLPQALNEFLDADEADEFVVAFELAEKSNRIVVTQEKSEPNRKNKIKIPDVCISMDIQYCNTIEMLRQLNETF